MTLRNVSKETPNSKFGLWLGYVLFFLCLGCQEEQVTRPNLNLDIAACLSPESNGCQDQLFALHQTQGSLTCLMLKVDNELKANIPVSWGENARLKLLEIPKIELFESQKVRASLIFAQSDGFQSCESFDESFDQGCSIISGCLLKLNSQESSLQGSALTINFQDGLGLCNIDRSQVKLNEAMENSPQLFQELYNDGKDNDCDSLIDEFISQPCTVDIDRCSSEGQTAVNELGDVYCNAPMIAVSPNELCGDAVDNDCDGNIDEGFNEEGSPCTPESTMIEASGRWVCLASDPTKLTCRDRSSALATDICNGFDDNGNGQIDEDAVVTEVECMNTACATEGLRRCEDGSFVTTCLSQAVEYQGQVVMEESVNPAFLCDGVDNNCDGEVDEDFVPTLRSCGQGACSNNQGMSRCTNGSIEVDCDPLPGTNEVCDEMDNDCDGQIDEEVDRSLLVNDRFNCGACGNVCPDGDNTQSLCQNGVCGFSECEMGYGDGPNPGPCDCRLIPNLSPSACCQNSETQCDGYDEDCDGNIDEGVLNSCGSCDNLVESCDPFDNDCDGQVDEGNVCGTAITTGCTAWFTHRREQQGTAPYIVSDVVSYQDRNTHFIPLAQQSNNELNLFPIAYQLNRVADYLVPQFSCLGLAGAWRTWIESNCRLTLIWGDRGNIDPWTCQDPSLNNTINPSCNVSSMTEDVLNPIQESIDQINLGLSCQDPSNGQDPQLSTARDRILSELSFKIALVQLPANGNSVCDALEDNTSVSIASCNDGFRGDNVICGLSESSTTQNNIATDWSSIDIPETSDNARRCYQFLFARSLTSSFTP